jgi:cobalt-zinc-cadmium efflux system outer membrane protein
MRSAACCLLFSLVSSLSLLAQGTSPEPDLLGEAFSRPPLGLDVFNGLALANNPTISQAAALVRRATGQAQQAGLWPNPMIGYQGEQIRGGAYGGGEQGAFVQQRIVLGGKLGLRRKVYSEQRRAGEIGATEQRVRVLSDVGQQFYEALAAQESVKLRKQLLAIASDAVETSRQLQNVGQADAPDVLQAEVEKEQAALEYNTAERTYIQEFRALAALAGKADLPLAPLAGSLEQPTPVDTGEIAEAVLRDSPSIKRARQSAAAAQAALKAAKRESIPDLTLRAGVEQNYEHLPEDSARTVGLQGFASLGITLPIFNRNQGNVSAAEAEFERARGEVTRIELSLTQAVQFLTQTYLTDVAQAQRYRDAMIPRAQRAYQLYLAKYRSMASAYPQVIVSQRTLFQLRVAYVGVLADLWRRAIALQNYALSDGLSAPTMPDTSAGFNLPTAGSGPEE